MKFYTLYFDGACGPTNPGGTGSYGYTIHQSGEKVKEGSGIIGQWSDMTNNFAEFYALYQGLEHLASVIEVPAYVEIKGDSSLVIRVMANQWRAKADRPYYKAYLNCHAVVKSLRRRGVRLSFSHIPREKNGWCDRLSKLHRS